jgi:hypothetical protein
MPAQKLAQTRRGAEGARLFSAAARLRERVLDFLKRVD